MKNLMKKISAFALAVILTLLAIPVLPIQATEAETTFKEILKVNFSGDEHYTPAVQTGTEGLVGADLLTTTVSADGSTVVLDNTASTVAGDTNMYYGGVTDIPLRNSGKVYAIDLDVKREDMNALFLMYYDWTGTYGKNGVMMKQNGGVDAYFYKMSGHNGSNMTHNGDLHVADNTGSLRVILDTVNGKVTIQVKTADGTYVDAVSFNEIMFVSDYLHLMFRMWSDRTGKKITVSNVVISEEVRSEEPEIRYNLVLDANFNGDEHYNPAIQTGTEGLAGTNLFTPVVSADGSSVVLDNTASTVANDTNVYYGGETDLPLRNSGKIYAIDMDVKREDMDATFTMYFDWTGTYGKNGFWMKRNGGVDAYFYKMSGHDGSGMTHFANMAVADNTCSIRILVDSVNNQITIMAKTAAGTYAEVVTYSEVMFTSDNLNLMFRVWSSRTGGKVTVSNLKVYEQVVEVAPEINVPTPVLNVNFNGDSHYAPAMQENGVGADKVIATPSTDGSSLVLDFTGATGASDVRAFYGGETDLPLKDKIYTIDFDVKREDRDAIFYLYVDSMDGSSGINGFMMKRVGGVYTYFYTMNGGSGVTVTRLAKRMFTTDDYVASIRLVIDAVNGQMTLMSLSENGRYAATIMQKDVQYVSDNLYLLFKCDSDRPSKKLTISNMKVYEGLLSNGMATTSAETEGELLLKVDDMSKPVTGNYGAVYVPGIDSYQGVPSVYEYDEVTGIGKKTVTTNPGNAAHTNTAFGGATNLRLGANAQYTIRYQLKFVGSGGSAMMFAWPHYDLGVGTYIHPTLGGTGIFGTVTQKYIAFTGYTEEMKTNGTVYCNDGFVDVAVEIDGFIIKQYINGVKMFEFDILSNGLGVQEQIGFPTDTLTLVFQDFMNPVPVGSTQCEYRNLEVYSGLVASNAWLSVTDGETKIKDNEKLSSASTFILPEANVASHQIFKGWMINGDANNLMASGETLSLLSGGKITVEAVYSTSQQDIWVQFRDAGNGKQDIRVVGVLDSLDYYEIGYRVSISYGGQNYSEDKALKYAYSSLTAKYGEEIVTAQSLGFADAGYLTSLVIKNIPAAGEITIELIPYYITVEGESAVYLDKVTLQLTDGALVS